MTLDRLPSELLATIFELCLDQPRRTLDTTSVPLLVCGVSARWRAIALSTPALWSTFALPGEMKPRHIELLQLWSLRAGGLPLTYKFATNHGETGEEALRIALIFCTRWEDVEMELPSASYIALGASPAVESLSFDALRRLVLRVALAPAPHANRDLITTALDITNAPLLRDFFISTRAENLACGVPWNRLDRLTIDSRDAVDTDPSSTFCILGRCTRLRRLVLLNNTTFELAYTGRTRICLPALTELTIAGAGISSALTLPALTHLKTTCLGVLRSDTPRVLATISKWNCPLTHLDLRLGHPVQITLTPILAAGPLGSPFLNLIYLHLDFKLPSGLVDIVDASKVLKDTINILPLLETLRMTSYFAGWKSPEAFKRMLTKRAQGHLRVFTLILPQVWSYASLSEGDVKEFLFLVQVLDLEVNVFGKEQTVLFPLDD
ncbi:hypothetical protein MKEN_00464400 [Mycena kentingensis (nom. inval.)]|nr:hypothetical protein MKEN_00464400 [Mycena kentingensis (nom. inval.)]